MSNVAKNFGILAIILSILHNYFDDPTKLFLNLCLAKFLNTSAKLFFLYTINDKWLFDSDTKKKSWQLVCRYDRFYQKIQRISYQFT